MTTIMMTIVLLHFLGKKKKNGEVVVFMVRYFAALGCPSYWSPRLVTSCNDFTSLFFRLPRAAGGARESRCTSESTYLGMYVGAWNLASKC